MAEKLTADFWYPSSLNERHHSDLNSRVEAALIEAVGDRFDGMDGGSFLSNDWDAPNMADNNPVVTVNSEAEAEELRQLIESVVKRPVTVSFL